MKENEPSEADKKLMTSPLWDAIAPVIREYYSGHRDQACLHLLRAITALQTPAAVPAQLPVPQPFSNPSFTTPAVSNADDVEQPELSSRTLVTALVSYMKENGVRECGNEDFHGILLSGGPINDPRVLLAAKVAELEEKLVVIQTDDADRRRMDWVERQGRFFEWSYRATRFKTWDIVANFEGANNETTVRETIDHWMKVQSDAAMEAAK